MTQTTALAAFTVGEALELEPETLKEFQQATVERMGRLSPAYHDYVNRLLGSVATVVGGQIQHEVNLPLSAGPSVEPPLEVHMEPVVSVPEPKIVEVPDSTVYTPPAEVEPVIDEDIEVEDTDIELEYSPDDIIALPEGLRLYRHEKNPKYMKKFLSGAIPEHEPVLEELSNEAASILTWEVLEFYTNVKIPAATPERKANQRERIEAHVGLFGPSTGIPELAKKMNLKDPSIYTGIGKVKEAIAERIGDDVPDLIRRAIVTATYGETENLFIDDDEVEEENIEPVIKSHLEEPPQPEILDNAKAVAAETEEVGQPESVEPHIVDAIEPEEETPAEFFRHFSVPANMRNLLLQSFPAQFGDRILELDPEQASPLTHELIEKYRSLVLPGMTDKHKEQRCEQLTKWTGLYGPTEYIESLALSYSTSTQAINSRINNAISALQVKVHPVAYKEMFRRVTTGSEPRRTAAVR
jgi:hypothetical protein